MGHLSKTFFATVALTHTVCFFFATTGAEAQKAVAARVPSEESGNYDKFCTEEWTRRGELNARMYDYCMAKQIKGHETLVYSQINIALCLGCRN
jgi:hypothetical protein